MYGARQFGSALSSRLALAASGMFLLEAPALVVTDLHWLGLVMFVAGSATAPMLITAMTLAQRLVPAAMVTEAIAVATTGILIGISIGASPRRMGGRTPRAASVLRRPGRCGSSGRRVGAGPLSPAQPGRGRRRLIAGRELLWL